MFKTRNYQPCYERTKHLTFNFLTCFPRFINGHSLILWLEDASNRKTCTVCQELCMLLMPNYKQGLYIILSMLIAESYLNFKMITQMLTITIKITNRHFKKNLSGPHYGYQEMLLKLVPIWILILIYQFADVVCNCSPEADQIKAHFFLGACPESFQL